MTAPTRLVATDPGAEVMPLTPALATEAAPLVAVSRAPETAEEAVPVMPSTALDADDVADSTALEAELEAEPTAPVEVEVMLPMSMVALLKTEVRPVR